MKEIKFSIIVPCYNEEENISRSIKSILNQDYKNFELIVVNDASTDNSKKIINSFKGKVKLLDKPKNEGRPKAVRDGVKIAKGDIITITDADCIAPKNWLSNIKKEFEKDEKIEGVGGVYEAVGKDPISLAGNMFERIFMDFGLIPNVLPGANSSYKRKSLIEIGGYPLRTWGADAIIDMKMREKKKKIKMNPDIIIKTEYPRKIKTVLKRKFYWGGGLANIIDKTKFRLGFLVRPIYFLILFLSLILTLINSFLNPKLFLISLSIFLGVVLIPTLFFLGLSLIWIIKEKKYQYLKALPVMLFLPLLQEISYFVGFMYVLIGGKLKNAWR